MVVDEECRRHINTVIDQFPSIPEKVDLRLNAQLGKGIAYILQDMLTAVAVLGFTEDVNTHGLPSFPSERDI
jgi:hypothetical protein